MMRLYKAIFKRWTDWEDLQAGVYDYNIYITQGRRRYDGKVDIRIRKVSKLNFSLRKFDLEDLEKIKDKP